MRNQTFSGRAGQDLEGLLTIIAENTKEMSRYEIELEDLGLSSSGSVVPVARGTGARSCADWVSIDRVVQVPAGGREDVPYRISVPMGTVGEYYAYVKVKRASARPEDARVVVLVEPALSVKIEVDVVGSRALELIPERVFYNPYLIDDGPGILVEISNGGEAKSAVEGDVLLYHGVRKVPVRAPIPVRPDGAPLVVYPGLSLELECPLTEALAPGDYRAEVRLLMAGRWRAQSSFQFAVQGTGVKGQAAGTQIEKSEFDLDVQAEPPFLEVLLPEKGTRTATIRVRNMEDEELTVTSEVTQVHQEINGFLTFSEYPEGVVPWVTVSPAKTTIPPRGATAFLVNVTRPDLGEEPFAMCAVRIRGAAGIDQQGWTSEADLGVPVIVIPPGSAAPELEIADLEAIRPTPDSNPSVGLLVVKNVGKRVAEISGKLKVERSPSGQTIQIMHLGQPHTLVLPPGGTREIRMPMPLLDKGTFHLLAQVEITDLSGSSVAKTLDFDCTKGPEQ